MVVGKGFDSPETQAAIAAQQAATATADETARAAAAAEAEEQEVTPAVEPGVEPGTTETTPEETAEAESTETETVADDTTEDSTALVNDTSNDGLDAALTDAGFDTAEIGKQVKANDGKFPEDVVKALKEKFNPEQVDAAIKGVEEQYAAAVKTATTKVDTMNTFIFGSLAGGDAEAGKAKFAELSKHCKENMTKEETDTINEMLRSNNKGVVKTGLEMAVTHWKGREKKMMTGDAEATRTIETKPEFKPLTKGDFFKLMKTEKYLTDPDYAKSVDDRRRKTQETEIATPGFYANDLVDQLGG